jgi:transcriptional regulator with XRE-family HTH domain
MGARKISRIEQHSRKRVSENIQRELYRRSMTVEELAKGAGVSRSQLFNVFNRSSSASTDFLSRVAHALGLEPSTLLE